jgi:acetyl-CoA synthetase
LLLQKANTTMRISTLQEYHTAYAESITKPDEFWYNIAQHFTWRTPPTLANLLQADFINANNKWLTNATLNITENCIDRHLVSHANTPAIIWEPNNPKQDSKIITYQQLYIKVNLMAHILKRNGVQKGDRVCLYMSMVPELAIAVLACARIGAIHSVIFGGFSAQSIADRLIDAQAKFIITQDGAYRGNKEIQLKHIVDDAICNLNFIEKIIVLQHSHTPVNINSNKEVWWHDEEAAVIAEGLTHFTAEEMKAEDPLFILYTSGSTGKPKGVVHTCGGYMLYTTYTFLNVFQYNAGDVYFCTADVGWITGHSYLIYGPLCNGATTLMFEGIPTWPNAGRLWDIVDKHKVNILYTAPTAMRSLMACGLEQFEGKNLSSLRVLGTVGEPINEEAWQWYYTHVGNSRCPIVDTWWQTETGGIMISNLAGITPQKPTYATWPLPGIQPILVDEQGNEIQGGNATKPNLPNATISGNLCIQAPWPSILRTTWGNHDRCIQTYFSTYPNRYFTGDGCLRDTDGNYRITGRVDDVLNVSGHRLGTAEVENAINSHKAVIESAVVGYPHDVKGQGVYAFVIIEENAIANIDLQKQIIQTVAKAIGSIAKPDKVQLVSGLPKTRSGKIMRRILRKIAEGDLNNFGDTSTLLDPDIVKVLVQGRVV